MLSGSGCYQQISISAGCGLPGALCHSKWLTGWKAELTSPRPRAEGDRDLDLLSLGDLVFWQYWSL